MALFLKGTVAGESWPLDEFTEITSASKLEDLEKWVAERSNQPRMVYRGQKKSSWRLRTSLERFCEENHSGDIYNVIQGAAEQTLTSEFKRGAHHFSSESVRKEDEFEWLSLMQHFGGPTRLMDWTQSAYVALYFAIEDAGKTDTPAIYALDVDVLEQALNEYWQKIESAENRRAIACLQSFRASRGGPEQRTTEINEFLGEHLGMGLKGVVAARPFKMNQRLSLQRGLFVVPLSTKESFEEQLAEVLQGYPHDHALFKVCVEPVVTRRDILHRLDQMNIHRSSLFPDLDGYTRSIKMRYESYRLRTLI